MSSWKLSLSIRGLRPLVVLSDGVICYREGALYKVGHDLKSPRLVGQLPTVGWARKIAQKLRFLDRVMRASPTHGVVINNTLLIARQSEIWRCDLDDGHISLEFNIPDGRRSLSFGLISQPDGTQEVLFGEYFSNFDKFPVRIWGRSEISGEWTQRAEFPRGEIEHIHAVSQIEDEIYILTGDFGDSAGVWVADRAFSELKPCLRGKQTYRAAWMTQLGNSIYYATDTQLELNGLYKWEKNQNSVSLHHLSSLDGSSIYAGLGPADVFFSTTVECGEPSGNFFRDLFDMKPGPGMRSKAATIMAVDGAGNVSQLHSAVKDFLPFRLAQFGTFVFPTGVMPKNTLIAYGIALNGADDECLLFTRD